MPESPAYALPYLDRGFAGHVLAHNQMQRCLDMLDQTAQRRVECVER